MDYPAVSRIRSESTYMRQSIEGLDKQFILSVNLDQQDCPFNEESFMSDSSEIQSEMLRIQDILCRMDTCCHLHSLCDLVWDSVLTYQDILQPEGGQVLIPKIAYPQVAMHFMKL